MKYTSANVYQLNKTGKPWQARLKYKTAEGKWKEVSKMLPEAKGKKEAQKLAEEWRAELNAKEDLMPSSEIDSTIEVIVLKYYKYRLDTGALEQSSYSRYIYAFNRYIKPYLGNHIFAEIDKTIIRNWLAQLYNKGYAQGTIRQAYTLLHTVYNYYYETGDLREDLFKGVTAPKKNKPRVTHLTDIQMRELIEAIERSYTPAHPMYCGIYLALYSGLRRGEICGLRWNDINFTAHTLTVRSAIGITVGSEGESTESYAKQPKSESSYRTFPMLSQLEEILFKCKAAIQPRENWFVLGNEEFMHPDNFSSHWFTFVRNNELRDAYGNYITPHGLRHNFATVGIKANMDIASLSLMLGHASRAMTLDIYGDANADALIVAADKLSDTFNEDIS